MAVLTSEAIVLRTWPVHEADLIVSFFTRDYGKVRGVAKSALKSRKRFGGALEPMTVARSWFAEKPKQDLVRLDQFEIITSPLTRSVDAARLAVLSFYAEVLEEALPERDPHEAIFRLTLSVLERTTVAESSTVQPWMPLTYFTLWITRLMGLLPDVAHCTVCGEALQADEVNFNFHADGFFCAVHRHTHDSLLAPDSWQMALRMLRAPVANFSAEDWPRRRGQDLRRFLQNTLERHLERKLRSAEALARL
jgi:DNA repair protein RecO (recombination protein O)